MSTGALSGEAAALDHVPRIDLGDAVADRLRTSILRGDLAPGERLVETALAQACGTSRGPIRDAIGRLEAAGLVTVTPRRGAYVATFDRDDVGEIYSLRASLETLAVQRAAANGTESDWAAMDAALDDLTAALAAGDPFAAGAADMRFHRALVAAAGHERLARAWDAFADQTLLLLRDLSRVEPDIQSATGGHRDIVDALRRRDAAGAERLLHDHLTTAQAAMSASFAPR
jgi:DNA-binding GntR family transcriptional regulator